MQFLRPPVETCLLGPNIFIVNLNLYFALKAKKQVLHLNKITSKIIRIHFILEPLCFTSDTNYGLQ
jgi:hypothetical protein